MPTAEAADAVAGSEDRRALRTEQQAPNNDWLLTRIEQIAGLLLRLCAVFPYLDGRPR